MFGLKGKVVLVTGAGQGIGRQVAISMAEAEAAVIASDVDFSKAQETVHEIEKMARNAYPLACDITNVEQVEAGIKKVADRFGTIDVLVNNAGLFREAKFVSMTSKQWEQHLNVNLTGVFNVTKAVVPFMLNNKAGNIISISSLDAFQGCSGYAHYTAAKAGVLGLTKTLALELGPENIRVNAIAPGITETDMTKERIKARKEFYIENIPLKRIGTPQDITNAVLFLASDLSSYITGQTLHVNGGWRFN